MALRGARVILVSAISPLTPPPGVEFVQVTSSDEMRTAVLDRLSDATIVIKAAAVACGSVKMTFTSSRLGPSPSSVSQLTDGRAGFVITLSS